MTLTRWKSRYSISGMIAGQEGNGRELPGMGHDAEKAASEGREQVCHSCYQLATGPLLLHTCRWATLLLLAGSRGGGGGGSAATGNSFGFPACRAAAVAAAQVAGEAHLQPEGLPANHRQEEEEEMKSWMSGGGFRVSRSDRAA